MFARGRGLRGRCYWPKSSQRSLGPLVLLFDKLLAGQALLSDLRKESRVPLYVTAVDKPPESLDLVGSRWAALCARRLQRDADAPSIELWIWARALYPPFRSEDEASQSEQAKYFPSFHATWTWKSLPTGWGCWMGRLFKGLPDNEVFADRWGHWILYIVV